VVILRDGGSSRCYLSIYVDFNYQSKRCSDVDLSNKVFRERESETETEIVEFIIGHGYGYGYD